MQAAHVWLPVLAKSGYESVCLVACSSLHIITSSFKWYVYPFEDLDRTSGGHARRVVGTWTDAKLEDDDNGEDCAVEFP